MSTYAPALAGVIVGALLTWFLGMLRDRTQREHSKREARRLEVLDLVSAFLADVATVQSARVAIANSVVEMQAHRNDPAANARRLEAFEERRLPYGRGEIAVQRMRLIVPSLPPLAASLLAAADLFTIDSYFEDERRQKEARDAFLAATRSVVQ